MATWREVAERLADRLIHMEGGCERHGIVKDGRFSDCPECRDYAAWAFYCAKAGMEPNPVRGVPTPLTEMMRLTPAVDTTDSKGGDS